MEIPLRNALRRMAEQGSDHQLGKAWVPGNAGESVLQGVGRDARKSAQRAHLSPYTGQAPDLGGDTAGIDCQR